MNYLDNAKLNDHLEISVDWLSFTFTSITDHTEVIRFLGYSLDELVSMPCGKSGYLYSLKSSMYNIYFLYGGREGMGVHVDVSGSAVSDLIQHFVSSRLVKTPFNSTALPVHGFDEAVFSEFIRWIFSHGGSFTRLDLALDNKHDLYYSVEDLWSAVSSGQCVSILRTKQYTQSITGNDPSGSTLSFGRRGGAIYLRVYDKKFEQNNKLKKAGQPLIDYDWVRWEFEFRKENGYADRVAALLRDSKNVGDVFNGILARYIRLVEKDASRNSRCTTSEKWLAFIGAVSPLRLFQKLETRTIEAVQNWLYHQVTPSLAALALYFGGSHDFLYDLIANGMPRLTSKHMRLIKSSPVGLVGGCV